MSRERKRCLGAAALVILLLGGCSGSKVATPDYAGEPLVTFRGQLQGGDGLDLSGGVRMALAWYPPPPLDASGQPARGLSQPASIVTEDVVYQGAFPQSYELRLYEPPPEEAIADYSDRGGPRRAASAVLIAYQDLDGNGRLDTVPTDGRPIDKVVGASADLFSLGGIFVVYAERDPGGAGIAGGIEPGFNLLGTWGTLPLDTPVLVGLRDDPGLDLLVCDAAIGRPTGRVQPCGVVLPHRLFYFASVGISEGAGYASFQIWDYNDPVADAQVTLGGRSVTLGPGGSYELFDPLATPLAPGGQQAFTVSVAGIGQESGTIELPGEFALLEPPRGASVTAGSTLKVSWTASPGAARYHVRLFDLSGTELSDEITRQTELEISVPAAVGRVLVTVDAAITTEGQNLTIGAVGHSRELSIVP